MSKVLHVKEGRRMNRNFITKESDCLMINKREYLSQLSFNSSRIRQDKKIELDMRQEYSGRELYEMIQNADDEGSPKVELVLTDDNHFHIKNWGDRPFTEGGLLSIMRSFLSTKTKESYQNAAVRPIGNKGLGFRSLLNWSDKIIIHSNGVQCSFSEDIAKREWKTIKDRGLKDGALTQKDINDFERERPNNLPLPILSIPEIDCDNITKQDCFDINGTCTTDVEILCKDQSVVSDIDSKLSSLPCSVLLFLRSIERIDIDNKGKKRVIKRNGAEVIDEGLEKITISDNGNNICFAVSKYQSDDRSFEVGVAYPMADFNNEHYMYSYFPTQVRLTVPAIYHGTFELNASRNHLVNSEQNKTVLKKLGEVAVKLSENLVNHNLLKGNNWGPFSILNFACADISTAMLSTLAESIKSNLGSAEILPRINSTFSSIDSTIRLGDKLASWLLGAKPEIYQETSLKNHLLPIDQGIFSSSRYLSDYVLEKINVWLDGIVDDIQVIANKKLLLEDRVDFIDAIVDCGSNSKNMSILIDANGEIIDGDKDNPAYVLSMSGNTILPKCLSIKSVDSKLINQLQEKWNLQIRQVTERLQKVTSVINGDHSAIRKKIELWSAKDMDCEGMCEVMKWEFDNPTKDATAFTSDLHLLNRLGERTNSCSLLLDEPTFSRELFEKINGKWLLLYSLSEWKDILSAKTEEEASHFLYKILGVSQRVPSRHIYFGRNLEYLNDVRNDNNKSQIGNYYCDNFDQYNKTSKEYNYSYVPDAEYLSMFSLSEALGLILKDERVLSDIMDKSISLFFRSKKSETVRCSFSAYSLKSSAQFLPLQYSVIQSTNFGCGIDYNYLEKELSIDRITQINPLLVTLGAQTNIGSFSTEQLYELLSQKVDSSGVQKRYKELREAIRNKNEDESVFNKIREKCLTHVWAREKGRLEWKPVGEVYYWDNDQLPQAILATLPKLEIGNRVGEDSVSKIFGVKLAKNVDISFSNQVNNDGLLKEMKKYLSDRIKYFLAFRIGDDIKNLGFIRQSVSALKGLCDNLYIYTSAQYKFNKELHCMKEGDILTSFENSGMHFHICSSHHNCTNAIFDPVFCENLNEAVCMALKVTSNAMANYFRNIITHDIHYIEYITKKDIAPEVWSLTLKSLGLSEYEQTFWKSYSDSQSIKIDLSQLAEHITDAREFICGIYPHLDLPETYTGIEVLGPYEKYKLLLSMKVDDCSILGDDGLKDFYQEFFMAVQKKCFGKYKNYLYNKTSNMISGSRQDALSYIEDYRDKCLSFNEPFFEGKVNEIKQELIGNEDLEKIMYELVQRKFNFSLDDCDDEVTDIPTAILPEYEKILDEFHMSEGSLNQIDALIAKFKGLEDLFRLQMKKYDDTDSILRKKGGLDDDTNKVVIEIARCHSVLRDLKSDMKNTNKGKFQNGYKSDRSKYQAGKNAEIKTFEAMKSSEQYEDVYGCSKILNKESGDDNLHYDITYRKKGTSKTDMRYLEVKNGTTFLMSCLEYQFALDNRENYDLAIYHDGKVSIIESPFSSKDGKKSLEAQPETYQLTIAWD